jgi:hypothetical protein
VDCITNMLGLDFAVGTALALDKLQMHQPAGGIVNIDEQGALRPAALKPPVLRAVDLDQLAHAVAPVSRLVQRLQPCAAILPQTGCDHPLPLSLSQTSSGW